MSWQRMVELNGTERSCSQIRVTCEAQQMEQTVFNNSKDSYKNVTDVNITNESSVEFNSFQFSYIFFQNFFYN
jgi:hypothetical protein